MVNAMGDIGGYSPLATASSCENGGSAGVGGMFARSNMGIPDFIDGSDGYGTRKNQNGDDPYITHNPRLSGALAKA
jgi:hypothetical protein